MMESVSLTKHYNKRAEAPWEGEWGDKPRPDEHCTRRISDYSSFSSHAQIGKALFIGLIHFAQYLHLIIMSVEGLIRALAFEEHLMLFANATEMRM